MSQGSRPRDDCGFDRAVDCSVGLVMTIIPAAPFMKSTTYQTRHCGV